MILVTGATGKTGGEVVRRLSAGGPPVRALVRAPERVAGRFGPNVEVVAGDLADPASLGAALDGVDKAYLVSSADPAQVELHGNFVRAAKAAGVRHVVRHSGMGANPDAENLLSRWHGQSERELENSGIAWTHVQPHLFMQNLLMDAASIRDQGAFYAPLDDAGISMVDVRDIAAVAVAALTGAGHEGRAYTVTGPEAVNFHDVARIFTRRLGRPVSYVAVTDEAARAAMLEAGLPEWFAESLIGLFQYFRTGQAAAVSDDLRRLTGQPGHTVDDFVRDHAEAFGAAAAATR